jgi:hypothetical protein
VQQQVPLSNDPIEEDRDGEWAMAMRRDAFNNEPEDHGASGIKIRNIGQDALDATTAKPTLVTPKRNAPGGIDFRSIDSAIRYKASTAENINKLNTADRSLNDGVEQDILQINRLIKARIIPSSERLKDCLRKAPASNQQGYNNQINNCLAEIFILEEEYAQPCDASFVDVLRKVVLNN